MLDSPGDIVDKNLPASAGGRGSVPGPEDSTCGAVTKPMYLNY